jgi:hypothetical protein
LGVDITFNKDVFGIIPDPDSGPGFALNAEIGAVAVTAKKTLDQSNPPDALNVLRFALSGRTTTIGDGVVAKITFQIKSYIPGTYVFAISPTASDKNSTPYTLIGKNTTYTVTAPTVTSFTSPATATSTTINITSFTAVDNVGYLMTESATPPLVSDAGWTTTAPVSYRFIGTIPSGVATSKTLYAWAKDSAGNISPAVSLSVTVTITPLNGVCGTSDKQTLNTSPITNLCASGTATPISGSGPWTWSCSGTNGGTTATCGANIPSYIVTATAGSGGSITPPTRTINYGATTTFTVTPSIGSSASGVNGCGGTLSGTTYTTAAITADCTVTALFGTNQYAVTATVIGGNGSVSCTNPVNYTATSTCTITPNSGYRLVTFVDNSIDKQATVSGNSYSIANVTVNHVITASFELKPDTIPPTVSISAPLFNSSQADVWELNATATDDNSVSTLEFMVSTIVSGKTYYLQINNGFDTTAAWITARSNSDKTQWTLNTSSVNWSDGKNYTITARATDIAGNSATATSTFTKVIVLLKEPATLTLDLSSSSIQNNATITVSGKLSRYCSANCTMINIQNRDVTVTISKDGLTIGAPITVKTTDIDGHFVINAINLFNQQGAYTISAVYAGTADLQSVASATKTVLVGKPAGYAIIIEGMLPNDKDGIASHTKSARRVYKTLKERNFADTNIYWFNQGAVNDTTAGNAPLPVNDIAPTFQKVADLISGGAPYANGQTLSQLMGSNPAPIYLIMIDHGSQGIFHLGEEKITPVNIADWLKTLDSKLNDTAKAEKKVIVIGACYSGSFIPVLSATGRIIITSASSGEQSYRGGFDGEDNIQSGEYFLDELFAGLKRFSSIKTAFKDAADKTWNYTRKSASPANGASSFNNAMQRPLLDDNGDGVGSFLLSVNGDGSSSDTLYLGASPGVNSISDPADISNVTLTSYLSSSDATMTTPLWATATNNAEVSSIWVELLRPAITLASSSGSSQLIRPLDAHDHHAMKPVNDRFEDSSFTFTDPGRYEAYYYAIDTQIGNPSPSKRSVIYKNKTGNHAPGAVNLTEPGTDGLIPNPDSSSPTLRIDPGTTILFQWEPGSDPDGDAVTYKVEICTDSAFTTNCQSKDEINDTFLLLGTEAGLKATTPYYWRVWSVDGYGERTVSASRSFVPKTTNALPGVIKGYIIDATTSKPVAGATVTIGTNSIKSIANGAFITLVSPSSYNLSVTAAGYQPKTLDSLVIVVSGRILDVSGALLPTSAKPGDCTTDGTVTITEVQSAINMFLGLKTVESCVDLDGANGVSIAEVQKVINSFWGL